MTAFAPDVEAALVDAVAESAASLHCPSIAWGVVRGGRVISGGGGIDTVFRIASMTKSFTAAAVLALRDEGLLSLDVPVAEYAPELAPVRGPAGSPPVTLRHLLSMRSGLATDDAWADRHLDITEAEVDEIYAAGPMFSFVTGSAFEYSNLGFGMIGRVVRRVTGRPVQEHVTERFLRPLGLTRTTWVQPDHDDWARPHRVVDDVAVPEGTPIPGDGEIAPMGGLWSTVSDLARWVHWLDEATRVPDAPSDLLSAASRREMQSTHTYMGTTPVAGRQAPASYGFGLRSMQESRMGRIVSHSGGVPGYGSNMSWLAGRDFAVVALANRTYAPMSTLNLELLGLLYEHGVLPRAPKADAPVFVDRCTRLVALLNDWDDARAATLFADNVDPDESFASRAAAARALVEQHGPLEVMELKPASAANGAVIVRGGSAVLRITVELAPLAGSPIQLYNVTTLSLDHAG